MRAALTFERLSLEINSEMDAPVARITLRNPPLNVIDIPLMEELATALMEVEAQPGIWGVVIRGDGKCFSVGVDVAAHTPDQITFMLEKFHAVIRALVQSRKITIAAVHGSCLGGAAELALVCDLVITAENAKWGFPEISLGCFPPAACTALSALVGQKRAAELILTGRKFSGSDAFAYGLATASVADGEVEQEVAHLSERFAQLSPATLAITKKAIYAWDSMHLDKGLARAEKIYLEELIKTEDAQEGIRAFLEKRSPRWKAQ